MNEMMTTILKLNKEIDYFITIQKSVLNSFENEKPEIYYNYKELQTLFETLRTNMTFLKEKKDILLGLKD